ncbi:MAG TPA: helix-turn-helix domain-containing protein [Acidimicrobiales bacterium]|nr:helix-turn-helix domain-containing protein [Acidimicrobiales bacterium]
MARPAPGADRSVAVLELLAGHPNERFTLSEVARRCDLNKATAHALLSTLSEHGVLLRHPQEKRYSLGPRLVAIGEAARRGYSAVDFVPAVLEDLSAGTGKWTRAFVRTGDRVEVVAQARAPSDVDRSRDVVLPLVAPIGVLWMAWSDAPTVEAWLARAVIGAAVRPALDVLPVVRRNGFAVTLASPEWRALSEPSHSRATREDPEPGEVRALLAALGRRPVLVSGIDDRSSYQVGEVAAPVFGMSGAVELTVAVSGLDRRELRGDELRALAERVKAAGDDLTTAIRGRRPPSAAPPTRRDPP